MPTTTAALLYAAGYRELVSVTPPGCKLSERSEIPDGREPGKPDQRGKAPGRFDGNRGTWGGYNWRELKPFPAHIEMWEKAGANIGLHARAFPAVDIDCMDPDLVHQVAEIARRILGQAPVRIGRAPKALLVYTTDTPFTRVRLHLKRGEQTGLIEILGDGQQYLVAGTHPGTMRPYEWVGKPLHEWDPLDDLTPIDLAKVDAFLEEVTLVCGLDGWDCEREGRGRVVAEGGLVQAHLAAPSFEAARAVVAAIPNTTELFPSRDAMNEMGYAIRACVGEPGLELFLDWCSRWTDGFNDPDYCTHEWERCVPPYRIGWEWLVAKAKQLGGYDDAQDDFDAPGGPMPPSDDFDAPGGPAGPSAPPSSPGGGDDPLPPPPKYSDYAVAQRFVNSYGSGFRFIAALGGWVIYSPARGTWSADEHGKAEAAMQRVCSSYAEMAQTDAGLNQQQRRSIVYGLTKAGTISNALRVAHTRKPIAGLGINDLDRDHLVLNTPGGLVDLRTGVLSPHDPGAFVSKTTAVAPAPGTPARWMRFLEEALAGDRELIDWLQLMAGYWLTGEVSEQQLTFLWGQGGNGKGVFANTLANLMGDYAARTPSATFAAVRNEAHPEIMARLRGARLVLASETQEGQAWNEEKVKGATGGDVITARFMAQNSFEYMPQFKLLFLGNNKPRIRSLDRAMKRRIHLVEMNVTPKVVNKHLAEELREEWPQILQWAIDGCQRWRRDGMRLPAAVVRATQEYFGEEDVIGQFLDECCDVSDPGGFATSMGLWKAWEHWSADHGEMVRTQTWFSRQIAARPEVEKIKRHPINQQRGFRGIKLLVEEEFDAPGGPAPTQKQKAR